MGAAAGVAAAMTGPVKAAATSRRGGPVITNDGARLFVRDWGDGAPVLFLAGWTLTSDMWAYQAAQLNDTGLRTIAYDRRGHGKSDDHGRYDFDALADDLDAVIEQLGLRNLTLVAHSMGGGEAVRYLSRHGAKQRVARVLFLAPALPCLGARPDNPGGFPAAAFEANRKAMARDFPGWLDANSAGFVTPATSQGTLDWIKGMMLQASMRALIDCNRAMTEADFRPELAAMRVPTRVVHGDKDLSAPLDFTGRRVAALAPGAKLSVIEGAPHGLFVTHADRVNAEISGFVRG